MKHTYSRIWMHYIWATKNNKPIITKTLIPLLIDQLKEKYPKGSDFYVDTVNGTSDHFHLLVGQMPVMSPSKVANLIKGASSHWINSNGLLTQRFAWQGGFSVFSVSHSMLKTVREYIYKQPEHHRNLTYEEEVKRFLIAHELEIKGYSSITD